MFKTKICKFRIRQNDYGAFAFRAIFNKYTPNTTVEHYLLSLLREDGFLAFNNVIENASLNRSNFTKTLLHFFSPNSGLNPNRTDILAVSPQKLTVCVAGFHRKEILPSPKSCERRRLDSWRLREGSLFVR